MSSITFLPRVPIPGVTITSGRGFARQAASALAWLREIAAPAPMRREDLLVLAAQYEATQPSYAADLRAAATRHDDC